MFIGVVEFYLVQYMQQVAGFNALEFGIVMGVQLISLIVSRPIMGRFSDKTSRRIPIILGCLHKRQLTVPDSVHDIFCGSDSNFHWLTA